MKSKTVSVIVLVLLLIGILTLVFDIQPARANGVEQYDWPMYGYDPACTSFSPSTAPNTNATAWVTDLPGGTGWAYPVVAEGKVFIGAGGYLNSFDENNGSLVWQFRAPAQPGYPVCSAVADGRVFFGTAEPGPEGCMYALNTTTGEQIWNFTTEGYTRNPVVVGDSLYFGVDLDNTGKIYCINTTTGAHIWNYTTQDMGVTVAVAYGKVYVGCGHWITPTKCRIYCFDMHDHSLVWSFDTGRDIGGVWAVANGKVYVSSSYEGSSCIVYAFNATNGDVVWSTTRYSNGEAGRGAVAYGKVFINLGYGAKGAYALNENNGDEIWAWRGSTIRGLAVADGKVFFQWGETDERLQAVNEGTGALLWSYKIGGGVHSMSSAVANGRVFVADHSDAKLYAFGDPYPVTRYNLTITTNTGGTTIPLPGTYSYSNGTTVSVTAIPDTGYILDHWELDGYNIGSQNPIAITMNQNYTLHAVFTSKYTLTIYSSPTGVTFTVDGVSHMTPWSGAYSEGSSVSLVMPEIHSVGDARYYWNQWSDGNTSWSRTVTMNKNITLTAYYTEPYYELTVTSSPITGIPFTINGVPQTTSYTEWLLAGSYTLIMPETHNGYVWSRWLEDGDTSRIKTILLQGTTWTAVYEPAPEPVGGKATPINIPMNKPETPTLWIWLTTIILPLIATAIFAKLKKKKQ